MEMLGWDLLFVLSPLYVAAWRQGWLGWLAALSMAAIGLVGALFFAGIGIVAGIAGEIAGESEAVKQQQVLMVGAVVVAIVGILPLAWKIVMEIRDGANVNAKDITDRKPSDTAATAKGQTGTIESLAPALHKAARDGTTAAVKALIAAGANVNATTDSGFTALHWAARNGHANVVKVLMAAGADVNSKDQMGRTPLDYANEAEHSGAVAALSAGGTD